MPNVGPLELAILLLIVLVIFGPKRLPSLGRQLGHGMREFKDSITGERKHDDERVALDADTNASEAGRQEPEPTPASHRASTEPEPGEQRTPAEPRS